MVAAAAAAAAAVAAVAAAAAAAAVAAVIAADASAAAAVALGAVKPTAADTARGAAKPTAVDDGRADGLCRRVCREHCRAPVEPRRRAPGRRLAALHLWPGHGYRRHLRYSSSSPRPEPGLLPVRQGQCLSSLKTSFFQRQIRGGRPFRIRRLISFLVVLTSFCSSFITKAFALAM